MYLWLCACAPGREGIVSFPTMLKTGEGAPSDSGPKRVQLRFAGVQFCLQPLRVVGNGRESTDHMISAGFSGNDLNEEFVASGAVVFRT